MNMLKKIWYAGFITLITQVYFRKISLYGKENIPAHGSVLFVGLHKNGAVDGFVYHRVLSPVTFMLAAQLRRNPVVRLFFDGIEVTLAVPPVHIFLHSPSSSDIVSVRKDKIQ